MCAMENDSGTESTVAAVLEVGGLSGAPSDDDDPVAKEAVPDDDDDDNDDDDGIIADDATPGTAKDDDRCTVADVVPMSSMSDTNRSSKHALCGWIPSVIPQSLLRSNKGRGGEGRGGGGCTPKKKNAHSGEREFPGGSPGACVSVVKEREDSPTQRRTCKRTKEAMMDGRGPRDDPFTQKAMDVRVRSFYPPFH